ncbi:DUF4880 domain-containing protein [Acinetobacter qingfengensis]|uniref:Uncharacterized protein n=1 Tax=Acinetobacter qingfengensis TaxID=1262585 RepID=A0A1E7R6J9_9GAMM|nr:FecR domain-containing protein [Acinetobacter qingfengensis]KAA8734678.1 DUF4880 domain-containing protein [Acinetobacter qingfengensis]OEY94948.1 hypothetical protein BJI46_13150 [Acinetobacter qingfengensis]
MSQQHSNEINELLLEQASEWLVILSSDECTENDRQAFKQWQQQSPQHQAAAKRMQTMVDNLTQLTHPQNQILPSKIIRDALDDQTKFEFEPPHFIIALLALFTITLAWYLLPIQYWMADSKSSYDGWRNEKLTDHSDIRISGHSAYNLHFDQQQRVVELLDGNILVDVAKDAKRPFVVKTKYAAITALGTRFMINQTDGQTILTMLESKVKVETAQQVQLIYAGQQAVIDVSGKISVKNIAPTLMEQAWNKQSLAVEEMPLDQVLGILQSYHRSKLYYDKKQLHSFRVTAVLPLNDQQKSLNLLQDSLPIQINDSIPWVIYINKKD